MIAVRVTFGPPESAPLVFHAHFIVFAVTFSFLLLEHDQLTKERVVSQQTYLLRSRKGRIKAGAEAPGPPLYQVNEVIKVTDTITFKK